MFHLLIVALAVLVASAAALSAADLKYSGSVRLSSPEHGPLGSLTEGESVRTYLKDEALPSAWDWRPQGLMTTDFNQHIPQYCGSCWAHSSSSTVADRIKIKTKGVKRDVIPAVQVLLNCGTAGSCGGGDIHAAFRWMHFNGIPDVKTLAPDVGIVPLEFDSQEL